MFKSHTKILWKSYSTEHLKEGPCKIWRFRKDPSLINIHSFLGSLKKVKRDSSVRWFWPVQSTKDGKLGIQNFYLFRLKWGEIYRDNIYFAYTETERRMRFIYVMIWNLKFLFVSANIDYKVLTLILVSSPGTLRKVNFWHKRKHFQTSYLSS